MLVVDANIPIRAVLGVRVRSLIVKYGAVVDLFAPDTAWAEAREHLPRIPEARGVPVEAGVVPLNSLEEIIQPVEFEAYGSFEHAARTRLASRDPDDWPVLATALALSSPIRTEDEDFFGAGVAALLRGRRIESSCSSARRDSRSRVAHARTQAQMGAGNTIESLGPLLCDPLRNLISCTGSSITGDLTDAKTLSLVPFVADSRLFRARRTCRP